MSQELCPNILYFNPDEMRGDFLSCSGHPVIQTPNFDRLAACGTSFEQCHVQNTVCTPSRCSFMTGWYVHNMGHRTLWNCLQPHEPNTLQYFKQAGYDVQMIGKNDLLSESALEQSVSDFYSGSHYSNKAGRPPEGDIHYDSFLFPPIEGPMAEEHLLENAIQYLRSRRDSEQPFFLFLPWGLPHCPYTCPEPFYSMYDPDDLPDLRPAELLQKPAFYRFIHEYRKLDQLNERELKRIAAVYMGMISYVDDLLGRLLDVLEETGLWDNTAVFAFSDHGDWAGDYGLVEKWPSGMDDCLTRVPMIVRAPGCPGGNVVKTPVECHDIMPTSLELAGIECRHTHFAHSMMPQLRGEDGDADRAVFTEGGYNTNEPHCFEGRDAGLLRKESIYYAKVQQQQEEPQSVSRAVSIRTSTHRYVKRPFDIDELYDLRSDPYELDNRIDDADCGAVLSELKERLLEWYVNTADVVPWEQDSRGYPSEHKLGVPQY